MVFPYQCMRAFTIFRSKQAIQSTDEKVDKHELIAKIQGKERRRKNERKNKSQYQKRNEIFNEDLFHGI